VRLTSFSLKEIKISNPSIGTPKELYFLLRD